MTNNPSNPLPDRKPPTGRRVFVAGPISGKEVDYIANLGEMFRASRRLMELGYSPFCPGTDFLLGIMGPPMEVERYRAVSLSWLAVSDCMCVINERITPGVQAEIQFALDHGIPIHCGLEDFE